MQNKIHLFLAFRLLMCNFVPQMNLYIFNPEHEIALASGLSNFTAPHAGRQLRGDLGFIAALWATDGDAVLVDHVERAQRKWSRLRQRVGGHSVVFVTADDLQFLSLNGIEPWGWNMALTSMLKRKGISSSLLPSADRLTLIRQLSHRRTAAQLLSLLQMDGTVGEAHECTTEHDIDMLRQRFGQLVMKAPWSSSGRGVRFDNNMLWARNVIERQGAVMVEPFYNKVKDFGMEFTALSDGTIRYDGLSLFHTKNGAYTGNLLATETIKRQRMSRYISLDLLDRVCNTIIARFDTKGYTGPFGVDMMIVKGEGATTLLHPCVEINLRRTMGHVALGLQPDDDDIMRVMRVIYDGTNYQLKIQRL